MASKNLLTFLPGIKKNIYSPVSQLSENDMIYIWEATSRFIENQMLQHKGVTVTGLGTFTFSEIKMNIGRSKFIIIQKPIFIFSEMFLRTHGLAYTKHLASGLIPVTPLNFSILSNETSFSRDLIELFVKEILLAISHCLSARQNIELPFYKVGKLLIHDTKAKMKFFRDFIKQLDSSGELEKAYRPHTAQSELSIMTNPMSSRLSTSTGLNLPSSSFEGDTELGRINNQDERKITAPQLIPKTASLISGQNKDKTYLVGHIPCQTSSDAFKTSETKHGPSSGIRHSHSYESTGQELCYFCHQKDQRNVYVDVSDIKKERERQCERILEEYRSRRDRLAIARESKSKRTIDLYKKDASSYNLDATLKKQSLALKRDEFHPSYIFQLRGDTPDKQLKQMEYCSKLDEQLKMVQEHLKETKDNKEKAEREERNELAKSLAASQEAYTKEKVEKVAHYQKALAEQIAMKSELYTKDSKETSSDGDRAGKKHPIFGVHDTFKDKKEVNQGILAQQLAVIAEKRRNAREESLRSKKEDAETLKRSRRELLQDIKDGVHDKFMQRKKLEESWNKRIHQYRQELTSCDGEYGIHLLQQCDKYKRCHRCQRHRDNRGQSTFSVTIPSI